MATRKSEPNAAPKPDTARRLDLTEALERQPAWIQSELAELRRHEPKILEALRSEERRALFLRDPAALLSGLGITVSGPLRQRLRADPAHAALLKPVAFRLPNGQLLQARINLHFTKARD
jgi:hypothetical protein